jgi:hypothetical protein
MSTAPIAVTPPAVKRPEFATAPIEFAVFDARNNPPETKFNTSLAFVKATLKFPPTFKLFNDNPPAGTVPAAVNFTFQSGWGTAGKTVAS